MPDRIWTIEVDGDSKKYKTIGFDRELEVDAPPTFNAQVKYDETINFWDPVEIKRDGTTEFKGYVEGIEIDWGSQDRYLNISGRDASVIVWKKYGEGFTDMDETLGGFFGKVSAVELLTFLLRCPQSDPVSTTYPNNKAGWGIDASRIVDLSAYRTSTGAPEWTILRKKGLGWRNSGTPFNEAVLKANVAVYDAWQHVGSPPYLTVHGDGNYIWSSTPNEEADRSEWSFENLSSEATSISNPKLRIYWGASLFWWLVADWDCYIWVASQGAWQWLFNQTGRYLGWTLLEFDLSNVITTIADLNAAKIKFINNSSIIQTQIDYCAIAVTYVTSGTQNINDYFKVDFAEIENICGIYFESRNDEESFPENYDIVSVLEDFIAWDTGWTEVDPNFHISLNGAKTIIYHDNYHAETAYYYYDYGVGGVEYADWLFAFKVTSSQAHPHAYIPFCFGTHLEKFHTQWNTSGHYFIALDFDDAGAGENQYSLRFSNKTTDTPTQEYLEPLALNTTYYIRFTKSGSNFEIYVYDDPSMNETTLLKHWSGINSNTLRYRYQALTWGNLEWALRFYDGFEDALTFTRYDGTAEAAFDTVDYIEGLRSFKITADSDEKYYLEEEFIEGDEAMVIFWVKPPAPQSEAVDRSDTIPPNGGDPMNVDGWGDEEVDPLAWDKEGDEPYLHDYGGGDANTIFKAAFDENIGYYDDYWTFENLNAKYQALIPSLGSNGNPHCNLRIFAKLYDGVDGHATSIDIRARIWVAHSSSWITLGYATCTSTSYQIAEFSIGSILTTLADWQNAKIKIDISAIVGGGSHSPSEVDKGGIKITYASLSCKGTAYWGRITIAKIYDKDVNGINDATVAIHGGFDARIIDETTNPDKYKWVIWGHDDVTPNWVQTSAFTFTPDTWYNMKLYVKKGAGDGFCKLYEIISGVHYERVSKTDLDNDGQGTPDCLDVEGKFTNQGAGIIKFDFVTIYSISASHSNGEIDSTGQQEVQLASVTNNIFRDCINSWQPQPLTNIKIKITANDATRSWAITQIYIYYAPVLKYRVYLDGLTPPESPPPYLGGPYIKALLFDSSYATPIGPLNIAMERLIDSINSIVSKCHNAYNPYRWWIEYDDDNTFHFKDRKGDDLPAIVFEKGVNLGGVTRTKSIESTVQRVKIIGRGEGKRQEEVSSDWTEDTDAMDEIRGFYEDVETQKVQANKILLDLAAQIKLKKDSGIEDQSVVKVNKDNNESMDYDVGDSVTITDILTGLSGLKTIYNITKDIDEDGEQITLVVGKAWKTQENEWADIYRRLKELGIVGTVADDWSGQATDKSAVDVTKVSDTWEQSASHDDIEIGDDITDPVWFKNPEDLTGKIEITSDKMGLYGPSSGSGVQTYEIEMRWDKKVSTVFPDGLQIEFNIPLTREPKLVCEGYCYQVESGDTKYWKEGDYVVFGLYNLQTTVGFLFKIVKGASAFTVYARYKTGGIWIDVPIRIISSNRKYRFEMYYDKKSHAFYWNVYDVENELEPDPISYVIINPENVEVKPIYAKIVADHNDELTLWARFYIFRLRTEWSRYEY